MKAISLHARGGPESFVYEDAPRPRPGKGEVLVRVHAAGVTPTELQWVPTWTTPEGAPRRFPIIPGHEFSGVIAAAGPGVTGFSEGDAVFGMNDWYRNGAHAEYCIANATGIATKPHAVDHIRAAATPIAALTALQGLFDRAQLRAGERVLIHGAAGAVGVFAVQLARQRGAHVIATAATHNESFVRQLGAAEFIDYKLTRFEDIVHDLDVVFDAVGGDTLERSWPVLKKGGRLVTIAASSEQTKDPRTKNSFFIVEPKQAQLKEVAGLIDTGELRPVVDKVFPLERAREAYEHKPLHGKVVLTVDSPST